MQIHNLKPVHKSKNKKRVGRGGKRGTYSGRGMKGQKSRAGRKLAPVIRELIKKYPKLRGYRFRSKIKEQRTKVVALNLDILEKEFKNGEKITPRILLEKRLISKIKGKIPEIKILGRGKIAKKLVVESCETSKGAKEKIEKAGGTIKSKVQMSNVKSNPKSK